MLQNNVCVLGLGHDSMATGSTGLEVAGQLVGQQIRLWQGSPLKVMVNLGLGICFLASEEEYLIGSKKLDMNFCVLKLYRCVLLA